MLCWQASLLVCWLVTLAAGMVPCTWAGAPIGLGAGFVCACICFALAGITTLLAAVVLEGFLGAATEMPPSSMLASLLPGAPPPSMALADVAVGGLSTTSHLGGPLTSLPGLYGSPRGMVLPQDPLAAAVFGLAHPEHAQDPRVLAAMQDAAARGIIGFAPQHHGGLVVRQMAQPAPVQGGQGGWAPAEQMQTQQMQSQMHQTQMQMQMQIQQQQQQLTMLQQQAAAAAAQQRQAWEAQPPPSKESLNEALAPPTGLSQAQEAELAARRRMASGEQASDGGGGGGSMRRADVVAASSVLTAQQQELLRLRMSAATASFGSDAALPGAALPAARPRLGFSPAPASSAQPLAPSGLVPPPLPPAPRGSV